MKIKLLDLEFDSEYFYIQSKSIVEKIIFNNRTFYSKFEKHLLPLNPILLQQHFHHEVTLAMPLIEHGMVNYIVIEYSNDDWKSFYALVKHLLKSLDIHNYQSYRNTKNSTLQIFIPILALPLEKAYKKIDVLKDTLELKSKRSYKIFPDKYLPEKQNIIMIPHEKA